MLANLAVTVAVAKWLARCVPQCHAEWYCSPWTMWATLCMNALKISTYGDVSFVGPCHKCRRGEEATHDAMQNQRSSSGIFAADSLVWCLGLLSVRTHTLDLDEIEMFRGS
jgi:hypothetical protein